MNPQTQTPIDDQSPLDAEDTGPAVAGERRRARPAITVIGFVIGALVLFLVLNGRRTERAEAALRPPASSAQQLEAAPPPLIAPAVAAPEHAGPFSGLPTHAAMPPPIVAAPVSGPSMNFAAQSGPTAADLAQRRRAPALIVDLGGSPRETVLAQTGAAPGVGVAAASAVGGQRPQLSDSEQFAKRVGDEEPDRARAVTMRGLGSIAPQGTIIPGVLETAINSDLPGFTRALVSRDVLSFDGKSVLIPRGSRLIGQYKSAVALGQSRAFVIWTRVIRPDGVSIQIGSPGTDQLGRGGLDGDVDRHFLRRFSGSILLSVLNAAVASVASTPSTQISIGSPGAASGLANSALQGDAIPPTVKIAQGQAINIFVARDLDFSDVEPVR